MGQTIELKAEDGFTLAAYRAEPAGKPKGGLVVIQEIFGVNRHMRGVTDEFARRGYLAICPALFDRAKRGVELGYTEKDIEAGRELRAAVGWDNPMKDVRAAIAAVKSAGKVGTVGYCWGGSVTWLTATRLQGIACAVCYYGGNIATFKDETPRVPVMFHFGEKDKGIPMTDVEAVRAAQPGQTLHVYPAGHGFNCEDRGDYDETCKALALDRTLAFFAKHIG
ncbi:MAG: dienelactone hydrolase family protein [Alphaproteobacteria bacterium]